MAIWYSLMGITLQYMQLEGEYNGPDGGIFQNLPSRAKARYYIIALKWFGKNLIPNGFSGGSSSAHIVSPGLFKAHPPIIAGPVLKATASMALLFGIKISAMAMGAGVAFSGLKWGQMDIVAMKAGVSVGWAHYSNGW